MWGGERYPPQRGAEEERKAWVLKERALHKPGTKLQWVGLEVGEVWKQEKVKESREKQEDYQKSRNSGRDQMYKQGGMEEPQYRARWFGHWWGRGCERLGEHKTQDKKCNRSPECQGVMEQRWGDWRGSSKLLSYEHEDLLRDEFSFSAKAGPGAVSAKLRGCSLGVTWPLWIWPKVKLRWQWPWDIRLQGVMERLRVPSLPQGKVWGRRYEAMTEWDQKVTGKVSARLKGRGLLHRATSYYLFLLP